MTALVMPDQLDPRLQDIHARRVQNDPPQHEYQSPRPWLPPPSADIPSLRHPVRPPFFTNLLDVQQPLQRPSSIPYQYDDAARTSEVQIQGQAVNDFKDGAKRARSCEACRGLKVRCEREPRSTEPCKRCAKAGRKCFFTEPNHKRKKKTDTKVAELEKKIDALTASLSAVKKASGQYSDSESSGEAPVEEDTSPAGMSSLGVPPQKRRKLSHPEGSGSTSPKSMSNHVRRPHGSSLFTSYSPQPPPAAVIYEHADVVDQQLLTLERAIEMFDFFCSHMIHHLPVVGFRRDETAAVIRRTKPVLFLTILCVASEALDPTFQRPLSREMLRMFADRVVFEGDKSLELAQALQIAAIWHVADDANDSRAFQFVHMACNVALTLRGHNKGLGGLPTLRSPMYSPRLPQAVRLEVLEVQRAWVSCYLLCGFITNGPRPQMAFQWSSVLDDAIDSLEHNAAAIASDRIICLWARLERIKGEFDAFMATREKATSETAADYERQCLAYEEAVEATDSASLRLAFRSTRSYLRLFASRPYEDTESIRGIAPRAKYLGPQVRSGKPLSQSYLEHLAHCIGPLHSVLDAFLALTHSQLENLPSFFLTRCMYGLIFLASIHISVVQSDLKNVIDLTRTRVDYYLTALEQLAEQSGTTRPRKVQAPIRILRKWFKRECEHGGGRGGHAPTNGRPALPTITRANDESSIAGDFTENSGFPKPSVPSNHDEGKGAAPTSAPTQSPPRGTGSTHTSRSSSGQVQRSLMTAAAITVTAPQPSPMSLGTTPLDLLSQVATSEDPIGLGRMYTHPQQQKQEENHKQQYLTQYQQKQQDPHPQPSGVVNPNGWYTSATTDTCAINPTSSPGYQLPLPTDSRDQEDSSSSPNASSTNTFYSTSIDPDFEEAMGMAFGNEGALYRPLVTNLFGFVPPSSLHDSGSADRSIGDGTRGQQHHADGAIGESAGFRGWRLPP